jgi:hypothetical protein
MTRMDVKDGQIVLPDGMSYRVLVLPDVDRMTPEVAEKIKQLVQAGATVYGPKPVASPSLSGFPKSDEQVKQIGDEVWGDCDGKNVTEHAFGKGRVVWGKKIGDVIGAKADFEANRPLVRYIHRRDGDADIYFVANGKPRTELADCTFRVDGKTPELWNPDTGTTEPAAAYTVKDGRTTVPLRFEPNGSVFVIFREPAKRGDPIASISRGGEQLLPAAAAKRPGGKLEITKASYGVLSDPKKQIDLTRKVAKKVEGGFLSVAANNAIAGKDPANLEKKQMRVEYTLDGKPGTVTVDENETLEIPAGIVSELPVAEPHGDSLVAWQPGQYEVKTASGAAKTVNVDAVPSPVEISGPWQLSFPPKMLAPDHVTLEKLESWTANPDDGVKHFSGTATYTKDFEVPADATGADKRLYLDLGDVKNLAEVTLNGKPIGILWKPPFRAEVTDAIKPGKNTLEVKVTNLWPNRMIGDLSLPEDKRVTWTAYQPFTKDSPLLESGLLGPVKIVAAKVVPVR